VLQSIAQEPSNDEIGKRLFLAQDTVKGYNRQIHDNLQVQQGMEIVAREISFQEQELLISPASR